MANPRQRSKARSHKSTKPSLNQKKRIHSKLRKTAPLRGPEALQNAWDKKKTVFQNYAALGLLPSIPVNKHATTSRSQRVQLPHLPPTEEAEAPKVGFGRIIRDEEGNVIDIIIDDEQEEKEEVEDEGEWKPLNDEDMGVEEEIVAKTAVVRELEKIAAQAAPVQRHTSSAEKVWLARMVQKYGDDFAAASRDRKLNVWQKTSGEIKRMVRKAGGVQVLQAVEA